VNRCSGERSCGATFLAVLVFSGYEKGLTWPLVFTFLDLFDVCSANSGKIVLRPFVLPSGCLSSYVGSKLALRAIIIPCRGRKKTKEKLKKKKNSLTLFSNLAIVALTP